MKKRKRGLRKRVISAILCASMVVTGPVIPPKDVSAAEMGKEPWLLSEGRPSYASSVGGGNKAIFATDGKMNTYWQAREITKGKNEGEWIDVDLGASADISSIELNWQGENEYAAGYSVLVSDDEVNWKEVYRKEEGNGGQAYQVYEVGEKKTPVEYAVQKEKVIIYGDDGGSREDWEWKAANKEQQKELDAFKADNHGIAYWIFRENVKDFTADAQGRYVRVKTTMSHAQSERENNYGYGVGLREIKIYGVGGVNSPASMDKNIAPGHPTKASTEVVDWDILRTSNGAFDGDDSTYWKSTENNDEWVQVDLEKVYKIGRMTIEWVAEFGRIFDIQTSLDGENWTTVYRQLHGIGEKEEIHMYQDARYVRMKGYAMGRGSGYTVKELQIFEYKAGDSKENPQIEPLPERQVVEVGEGSYLIDDMNLRQPREPYYVTSNIKTPIVSNDWWSSVLFQRLSDAIVPLPMALQYGDTGLGLYYANEQYITQSSEWGASGVIGSGCEQNDLTIHTSEIKGTPSSRADAYGDWSVDVVWSDDDTPKMKTTMVKGSPFIYNTFTDPSAVEVSAYEFKRFFDEKNQSLLEKDGDSIVTDHIGVVTGNLSKGAPDLNGRENKEQEHTFGIYVPEGTRITRLGSKIKIELGNNQNYMTVGVLDTDIDLSYQYQYAYTYVTDTVVDYDYNEKTGIVTTEYNCNVEQKRPGEGFKDETLMLLFPHQWRNMDAGEQSDKAYSSVRGKLKIHEGNNFSYGLKFNGIIPSFSNPGKDAGTGAATSNYDEELMRDYLEMFKESTVSNYWIADPYWQGKKTHPMAMGILIAEQLGDYETRDLLIKNLRKILVNWLSYDGEDDFPYHTFYSGSWGALNGNGGDFGMAMNLTDHHFVWAYFIYPAAVLASYDPTFVEEYGDMLEMLIRDCMNPDKDDDLFPFMRNFDPYEGHSWAGGYCDNPDGNNQESAGEATFAWAGLYLWGLVTGNDKYRDAGIWGWTSESNAILEYWFDVHDDIWTERYQEGCIGMVFGLTYNNGTYFGVNPSSIFGIHLLPVTPAQSYMGYNQEYASDIYAKYRFAQDRYQKWLSDNSKPEDPEGWYHIMLPFLAQSDPAKAVEIWDEQWNQMNEDKTQHTSNLAKEKDELFSSYWYIQNMNAKGHFTDEIWSDNYTSYQVFKKNDKYTATVWNPTNQPITVTFRNADGKTGEAIVAANSLVDVDPTKTASYGEEPPAADLYEDVYGVPGVIKAADYYTNKECSVTEGDAVGAIRNNSSLVYKIDVAEAGDYVVEYKIKSINKTAGGKIRAKTSLSDDTLSTVEFVNDENWKPETWTTIKGDITLQAGQQDFQIIYSKAENDYDEIWLSQIQIYKKGTTPPSADEDGNVLESLPEISLEEATATASNEKQAAQNAIDGNLDTRWETIEEDPQFINIELPEVTKIGGIKIKWEGAAAKKYTIDISEDGQNWTTAYTKENGQPGETFAAKFDSIYMAKYVRVNGTERVGGYGYSIYEINLYGSGEDQRILLDTPELTAEKDGESNVKLSWNAVDSVKEYKIYRALSLKAAKKEIAVVTDTSYTDKNLTQGTYYYWVVASPGTSDTYGDSKYSKDIKGIHISVPAIPLDTVEVTAEKEDNAVKITWNKAENAKTYEIYRTTGILPKKRIAVVTDLSYVDANLPAGEYSYRVVAVPEDNSGYTRSDYSAVTDKIQIYEKLSAPVVKAEKSGDDAVKLSWDAINNAESYKIYRALSADGEKAFVKSVTGSTGYTDFNLTDGTYYYWVIASPKNKNYLESDYSADIQGVTLNATGNEKVEAQEITLNKTEAELTVGGRITLTASITPENVSDSSVVWSSSDTDVATVSAGIVKAVKEGTATITAKTANGKTAVCSITVKAAPSDDEDDNNEEGNPGSNPGGEETDKPEQGENPGSGENDKPEQEQNPGGSQENKPEQEGNPGGSQEDKPIQGGGQDDDTPNTEEQFTVSGVKLAVANRPYGIKTVYLKKKATISLAATVTTNGKDKSVKYATSNSKVATVNAKGQVKAKSKTGTAKITATSAADPTRKAVITVKVVKKAASNKVLKLKKTKIQLKAKGQKSQIKIAKYTKKTTDSVKYKILSGKKYVKIDKYGVITSRVNPVKKAVKAKIQVTCGKKKAVVTVTIPKKK